MKIANAKQAHDDDDRGCSLALSLALDTGGSGEEGSSLTTSSAGSRISLDLSLSTLDHPSSN